MPMDMSSLEFLQMLSRPDTGSMEETVLAQNMVNLIENQYKVIELIFEILDLIDEKLGE
jgi:hypothetical protein